MKRNRIFEQLTRRRNARQSRRIPIAGIVEPLRRYPIVLPLLFTLLAASLAFGIAFAFNRPFTLRRAVDEPVDELVEEVMA